jgi:hypothetical protein
MKRRLTLTFIIAVLFNLGVAKNYSNPPDPQPTQFKIFFDTLHASCADMARIRPENRAESSTPPAGKRLHQGCPRVARGGSH